MGEGDIVGREISVYDDRSLAVEVAQALSHVMKDWVADLLWPCCSMQEVRLLGRNSMTRMGVITPCWK